MLASVQFSRQRRFSSVLTEVLARLACGGIAPRNSVSVLFGRMRLWRYWRPLGAGGALSTQDTGLAMSTKLALGDMVRTIMRSLLTIWLLVVMPFPAYTQPSVGDEILESADIDFQMIIKNATLTTNGRYATSSRLRFQGRTPAGDAVLGKGNVRIREISGFDPSVLRQISGSGVLRYQGGVSEVYGDGSYDLTLYGELHTETVDANVSQGVMRVETGIFVGNALVRPTTVTPRPLSTD